jgi:signal transduction histidine kinase/ActR/RegA family two-component response regulator
VRGGREEVRGRLRSTGLPGLSRAVSWLRKMMMGRLGFFRATRLRTKLLLSFLAITVCLSTATLLVVRSHVEKGIRDSIQTQLADSVRTYQAFASQREEVMARSTAQLANLPNVRSLIGTHDSLTIQGEARELMTLAGSDLLVLADRSGNVQGLELKREGITKDQATTLLKMSVLKNEGQAWWSGDGRLYEVWLQPIYFGTEDAGSVSGILATGREVTGNMARDYSRVVSGDIVIQNFGETVASTLTMSENETLKSVELRPNEGKTPREVKIDDERYLASTVSLSTGEGATVTLTVMQSLDKAAQFLRALNQILLALGLTGLAAAGVLIFMISRTFTQPLESLVAGAKALEKGNFEYKLAPAGGDEIGEMTVAFEGMRKSLQTTQAEQKLLEERLRQAHKMEAVGRLAGGVAHDFNNLLTVIRGNSDLLAERGGGDVRQQKYIDQIQKAGERAVSLTRQLLAFSRMQVLQPKVVDLNKIAVDMNKIIPRLIGEHIEFQFEAGADTGTVLADPGQLEQVLMNLAVNARDAMPTGGKLLVRTERVAMDEKEARKRPPMEAGEYALLQVTDTGHGMDAETKTRIFEPFFTTKEVGKGTGLGLATVYGIVKQSNGFIWVESEVGRGTTFEIYFPSCRVAEEKTSVGETKSGAVVGGKGTILVAEDEDGVRELAREFLESGGYTVLTAKDGVSALEIAADFRRNIQLVLTDMIMPKMNGNQLAEELAKRRPELEVIYMTGYAEFPSSQLERQFGATNLLQKPFTRVSLLSRVQEIMAGKEKV